MQVCSKEMLAAQQAEQGQSDTPWLRPSLFALASSQTTGGKERSKRRGERINLELLLDPTSALMLDRMVLDRKNDDAYPAYLCRDTLFWETFSM